LRKPGKLPAAKIGIDYALEYGTDRLEMHADAVCPGTRVLIVDDVLATGGTLAAAAELVARTEAEIIGAAVVIEISVLAGRARWHSKAPLHALLVYD
jgi:adenine phosphoribosyltransferase